MTIHEIVEYLEDVKGTYPYGSAKCPAHDDDDRSLKLKALPDKTLIYCTEGCEAKDIMAAIGLTLRDLYI